MKQLSCGILNYYSENGKIYVLLASAGGPYFEYNKCFSIPKGLKEENETEKEAAIREFVEETNLKFVNNVQFLDTIKQSKFKDVSCFILNEKLDLSDFKSNTFEMEYPKGSSNIQEFPEIEKIEYVELEKAKEIIVKGQIQLLEKLDNLIKGIDEFER